MLLLTDLVVQLLGAHPLGRARGLEAHEFPRGIYVESGVLLDAAAPEGGPPLAFSVENGCLTPSLKLRRRALLARYRQQVDAFYERLS